MKEDFFVKIRNQILGILIGAAMTGIGINVIFILSYGTSVNNQNSAIEQNRNDIRLLLDYHLKNNNHE